MNILKHLMNRLLIIALVVATSLITVKLKNDSIEKYDRFVKTRVVKIIKGDPKTTVETENGTLYLDHPLDIDIVEGGYYVFKVQAKGRILLYNNIEDAIHINPAVGK